MCTVVKEGVHPYAVPRRGNLKEIVAGLATKKFTTLPTFPNDYEQFVSDAERLSVLCGVDPHTVTKKVPSENPDAVSDATIKKFFEAEEQCAEANLRLGLPFAKNGEFPDSSDLFCEDVLCHSEDLVLTSDARKLLDLTVDELNKLVTLDWELADSTPFGPGVTQVPGFRTKNLIEKLTQPTYDWPNPDFVPNDYFVDDVAWTLWERFSGNYTCDVISQVPKNSTINRTIGITSFVPLAAQGVCGDYIRRCLKHHGIDLDTLADTHRTLAEVGSRLGNLATIDFSMASDTISRGLVWAALNNSRSSDRCRELYHKLCGCRTWEYTIDGVCYTYNKFSAMGNKFTFELESLLFTAIARAIERLYHFQTPYCRKATSLGDDTIIYALDLLLGRYKPLIIGLYAELGLRVNPEKSFFTGSFKESCGADYRNGAYVRGFYLHSRTVTLRDVVRCINHFTLYYGVALLWILEHCPFISRVFTDYRLDQVCYENWQFVDQLASLPVHQIGAVDDFIVVDHMSYRTLRLDGRFILSYENIDPLKSYRAYIKKQGRKALVRRYKFDGPTERRCRRQLLSRLEVSSLDLILALQSTTSNRRLARRWEAICEQERSENRYIFAAAGVVFSMPVCDEPATCWLTPPSLGMRVKLRAYNPAWPLTIPERRLAQF